MEDIIHDKIWTGNGMEKKEKLSNCVIDDQNLVLLFPFLKIIYQIA